MNGFESLLAEPQDITIKGVTLKLEPISVRDYAKLAKYQEEKNHDAIKELVFENIARGNPEFTKEHFEKMKMSVFTEIINNIVKMSDLGDEVEKQLATEGSQ